MKHLFITLSLSLASLMAAPASAATRGSAPIVDDVDALVAKDFAFAQQQAKVAFTAIDYAREHESAESRAERERKGWSGLTNPRSVHPDGSLLLVPSKDWCSGFFPGELWYIYEYTGNPYWKEQADKYTRLIEREKLNGGTHDMGFKMYCSWGNGYRLTQDPYYREVLVQSARTLITRFKPKAGIIRSWDHNKDKWQCPVIIDNMLNLELLFWATKATGDSTFYRIAVSHAKTTMKNHFRKNYSTWHVVDYDTITGNVIKKNTHQGFSDDSEWARGQAWALYGYTMCYRETGIKEFLNQAKRVERYIFTSKTMPKDLIPYWDFKAPGIPDEPRDVSAAACMASALYELATFVPSKAKLYRAEADKIISSISQHYLATAGGDHGFITLHSTGSKPHNSEIDVPLSYADYYFLEALIRKQKMK